MKKRATRESELGLEVQCSQCKEFWPADQEFFYFLRGQPHSWCKACYMGSESFARKRERFLVKQKQQAAAKRASRSTPEVRT